MQIATRTRVTRAQTRIELRKLEKRRNIAAWAAVTVLAAVGIAGIIATGDLAAYGY